MTATQPAFRDWCLGHSGCSGGDVGSPGRPAIWVCGIEPGGVHSVTPQALAAKVRAEDMSKPLPGYADWRRNLAHSFTRRIVKLLTAVAGGAVADYRDFAEQQRPFTRGASGYCRFNLYPVGFADTNPARWSADFARVTGFASKADYLAWCDANRLPRLRGWAEACRPRLVVGLGKSYRDKFAMAFADPGTAFQEEWVGAKQLSWTRNAQGTVVAVLPFLTSPSGLQSDAVLQAFGARLRAVLVPQAGSSAHGPLRHAGRARRASPQTAGARGA